MEPSEQRKEALLVDGDAGLRQNLITAGKNYRDLGFYTKALESYREAEKIEGDLDLSLKISGVMNEQGRAPLAFNEISKAMKLYRTTTKDYETVAAGELFRTYLEAVMEARFGNALRFGCDIFDHYVRVEQVEELSGRKLYMLGMFVGLWIQASFTKARMNEFPLDKSEIQKLYKNLVDTEQFDKAWRVADYVNAGRLRVELQDLTLLEDLLAHPKLPELSRANTLEIHADILYHSGENERSEAELCEAERLFMKLGHRVEVLRIQLIRLSRESNRSEGLGTDRKDTLLAIKKEMRDVGDWLGVVKTLSQLYGLAVKSSDEELLLQLDREYEQIRPTCMTPFAAFMNEVDRFSHHGISRFNTAKQIRSTELLCDSFQDRDVPLHHMRTAWALLSTAYRKIGDLEKAKECSSKIDDSLSGDSLEQKLFSSYTKSSIRGLLEDIGKSRIVPPLSEELEQLGEYLHRLIEDVKQRRWSSIGQGLSIAKIMMAENEYRAQSALRPFESTKKLVETCWEAAESVLNFLEPDERSDVEGLILFRKAEWMSWEKAESLRLYNMNPELTLERVIQQQRDHARMTEEAKSLLLMALKKLRDPNLYTNKSSVLRTIGSCYQDLCYSVQIDARVSINPQTFLSADEYYSAAEAACNAAGDQDIRLQQLCITQLHSLWLFGLRFGLILPPDDCREKVSVEDQCRKWLGRAKGIVDLERHDLAALGTQHSLLAKQFLRSSNASKALYSDAIDLSLLLNDNYGLWNWIQEAKGRSVSDVLALGMNIPMTLAGRIKADQEARRFLKDEEELTKRLRYESDGSGFALRMELEALRKRMRTNTTLQDLLALREGDPATLLRLRELSELCKGRQWKNRRVFYIDYFFHGNIARMLAVSNIDIQYFNLDFLESDLDEWRECYLHRQPEDPKDPLDTMDISPLQGLSPLVEPLVKLTKEGDLIILCASGVLHRIPIHAATVDPNATTTLIERNPIVYTANMTVLEQCASRSLGDDLHANELLNTVVAVYERPDKDYPNWRSQQKLIYDLSEELSSKFAGNRSVAKGRAVTKNLFKAACEESCSVTFFGHCEEMVPNLLQQHLLLAPNQDDDNEDAVAAQFSVSDVFNIRIRASQFNLIACGSANQLIEAGDEPLGLVTALLCAGANSVLGTMWPVAIRVGCEFVKEYIQQQTTQAEGQEEDVIYLAIALQRTIIEMKNQANTSNPYHWAPFVLHGSWFSRR